MAVARFNIAEIARSLEQTRVLFEDIDEPFDAAHCSMTAEALANMVQGYCFVDRLLAQGTNPFAMGNSGLLLEINALVLCGSDEQYRESFRPHLEQTRRKFYDDAQGGVGALMEWREFHQHDNLWRKAAGLYIQITSQPQLFIEGNHRSAVLMVSYMLGREGYPPFVLTPDNARELLDRSGAIAEVKKHGLSALIQLPRLCGHLATVLRNGLEQRHSLGAGLAV